MKPEIRLRNTSSVVIVPWNSLKTLSSWRDNHITISSRFQPISELCTVSCPTSKEKSAGYFLLVPDWVVLHHVYKIISLLKHNFQKSIYPPFITIFIQSRPDIVLLFVYHNLWLYIMVLVWHRNTAQEYLRSQSFIGTKWERHYAVQ